MNRRSPVKKAVLVWYKINKLSLLSSLIVMRDCLLNLQAGPAALEHLHQHGLHIRDFGYMLAASGGPKWLVLAGLDKYLTQEHPVDMQGIYGLGTSAGAFRLACYARQDATQAITQFAHDYINTTYSGPRPPMEERDNSVKNILDGIVLGKEKDIISSPNMRPHWITSQCHGLGQRANWMTQIAHLGLSYMANRVRREALGLLYSRSCFIPEDSRLQLQDPHQLPTDYHHLSSNNLYDSLLASGTIPLFSPVRQNIVGAPGNHVDGGLLDYHFDMQLQGATKPLVLYPHFSAQPRAGWFDKKLTRQPRPSSYDKVLLLTPSAAFLARLKQQRLPERGDFRAYDDITRKQAWQQAVDLSNYLAEELQKVIVTQDLSLIKPLRLT